jgi:hypothetical protein
MGAVVIIFPFGYSSVDETRREARYYSAMHAPCSCFFPLLKKKDEKSRRKNPNNQSINQFNLWFQVCLQLTAATVGEIIFDGDHETMYVYYLFLDRRTRHHHHQLLLLLLLLE